MKLIPGNLGGGETRLKSVIVVVVFLRIAFLQGPNLKAVEPQKQQTFILNFLNAEQ